MDVFVVGVGQVPVTRHGQMTERAMGAAAVRAALADAGSDAVDALYVGNMTGGALSRQRQMGVGVATDVGLAGIEVLRVEVASASGAGALRAGVLAIASGLCERVVVLGVERMTHVSFEAITAELATGADAEAEADASFLSLNALLMREYLRRYSLDADALAPFAAIAHGNAMRNPNAVFGRQVTADEYAASRVVAEPIRLLDASPLCDGAAAIVLARQPQPGRAAIRIAGSAVVTDHFAITQRPDPLALAAAGRSLSGALAQAGLGREHVDFFEAHDAYTIMAALTLESCGFAPAGRAAEAAANGHFERDGTLPIATMGGLKGRGHPVGATGIYQAAECVLQLRGEAGACQLERARVGVAQNLGGAAATVLTHVFVAQ